MNHKYKINTDWKRLADQIVLSNQRILVLGASDAGKSTFCRFLIDYACAASWKVALVDSDIGQSQIGPPTTIGMKLYESTQVNDKLNLPYGGYGIKQNPTQKNPDSLSNEVLQTKHNEELIHTADALYFVGAISPQRNLLQVLTGTRLMVDTAYNLGADFIVVDTSGYVHDGAAAMLKQQKIDLIRPHHVVCIGRSKDLERIVGCYGNVNWLTIHHLLPHKLARKISSEARKRNRKAKFKDYFADSQVQEIPFEQIRGARTPFFIGRIANQKELDILSGLVESEIEYAEWGHRSLSLIARRKLPTNATKGLKTYLSLSYISSETTAYFEQRLVGLVDEEGTTLAVGKIEDVDYKNKKLLIRCDEGIGSIVKVLQFGDYQFSGK